MRRRGTRRTATSASRAGAGAGGARGGRGSARSTLQATFDHGERGLRALARSRGQRRPRLRRALGRPPPGRGHDRARPDRDPALRAARPIGATRPAPLDRPRPSCAAARSRSCAAARRRRPRGRALLTGFPSQASTGTRARVLTRSSSARRSFGSAPSSSSWRMLALRPRQASSNRNTRSRGSCSVARSTGTPPRCRPGAARATSADPPRSRSGEALARQPPDAARRTRRGSGVEGAQALAGPEVGRGAARNERIMWTAASVLRRDRVQRDEQHDPEPDQARSRDRRARPSGCLRQERAPPAITAASASAVSTSRYGKRAASCRAGRG